MSFISPTFLGFVALLAIIYRVAPRAGRPYILVVGNLFFLIAAGPLTLVPFLGITCLTLVCANGVTRSERNSAKKAWLWLCVIGNLAVILWARTFSEEGAYGFMLPMFSSDFLTLGLSFYALQSIDYVVLQSNSGVRRLGLIQILTYLGFFPKFPAGPIEPAERFLAQSAAERSLNADNALSAIKRILWGVFKKVVIANRLGLISGPILADPSRFTGAEILLGIYALAFQIFCDFSAYCDIAIGVARLFGYDLLENFANPYMSRSVREFWHRWHMTLTSWLKRHVYLPLGGSRVAKSRWLMNVVVVFAVSGLWHGAAATFFLWAGIHAFLYLFGRITENPRARVAQRIESLLGAPIVHMFQVLVTFHLVAFAWIPFASSSVEQAWEIIRNLTHIQVQATIAEINVLESLAGLEGVLLFVGMIAWFLISGNEWFKELFFHISAGRRILAELALVDVLLVLIIFSAGVPGAEFMYVHY